MHAGRQRVDRARRFALLGLPPPQATEHPYSTYRQADRQRSIREKFFVTVQRRLAPDRPHIPGRGTPCARAAARLRAALVAFGFQATTVRSSCQCSGVGLFAGMIDAYSSLDDVGHAAINRGSAELLFARLAT